MNALFTIVILRERLFTRLLIREHPMKGISFSQTFSIKIRTRLGSSFRASDNIRARVYADEYMLNVKKVKRSSSFSPAF
jgi:hypothetical protein